MLPCAVSHGTAVCRNAARNSRDFSTNKISRIAILVPGYSWCKSNTSPPHSLLRFQFRAASFAQVTPASMGCPMQDAQPVWLQGLDFGKPGGGVHALSLEVFKASLDGVLSAFHSSSEEKVVPAQNNSLELDNPEGFLQCKSFYDKE